MRGPFSPVFVGRDAEHAEVTDAIVGRRRRVVIIEGEAGVGKTRLITEVLAGLPASQERVLVTRCPPMRVPFTLGALVETISRSPGDVVEFGPLAGALRPLFPEWADRLPPAPAPAEDRGMERHRLFRALTGLLSALGVGTVVVEDLHWADETTFEFLLHLVTLDEPVIGVVATWRPEDLPDHDLIARLTRIAADQRGQRLRLEPLDVEATSALIASMLRRRGLSRSLAIHLHERTQGVPLLIEEMVRSLYDRAGPGGFAGEWTAARVRSLAPPPSLGDSVLARMDAMSASARLAARALAVLAEPADAALISQVSGLAPHAAWDAIEEAAAAYLITSGPDGRLAFRHGLVLDAIAGQVPPLQRARLHQQAAAVLSRTAQPPVARLAWHLKEAGDLGGWARHAEKVADLALAAGDHVAAKDILVDLITCTEQEPEDLTRLAAKIQLPAITGEDEGQRLATALRAAAGRAHLAPLVEGKLRYQLARIIGNAGDILGGRAETERAIPLLVTHPSLAGRAMINLVHLSWLDWPERTREWWLRRASRLMRAGDASELQLAVDLTTVLLRFGAEEGWAQAAKLPMRSSATADRLLVVRGLANVGHCALIWGRYDQADTYLTAAAELAVEYGYRLVRVAVGVMQVHLDYLRGRWTGRAVELEEICDDETIPASVRLEAGVVADLIGIAEGWPADAEKRLRAALVDSADLLGPELFVEACAGLAEITLAGGRSGEAVQVTEQPFGLLCRTGVWIWGSSLVLARVRALLAAGYLDEARDTVASLEQGLAGKDAPAAAAALLTARALVAGAAGDEETGQLFCQAAGGWERLGRPLETLRAREGAARYHLRAGARGAVSDLRGILRDYSRFGAVPDGQRAAGLLNALGVSVRAPGNRGGRPGYGENLSPREREVAELVAAGRTDAEIAAALYKSLNTVRSQVKAAKRKLGVSTREDLARVVSQERPKTTMAAGREPGGHQRMAG
ncbi:MAG TPA: AAA family ATPase [Trebonia sp.]|jgi:DNA-binding CsgD family transcriptional regulator|nr:AAA family ATPase [Trebonia sp.]